jgi:hypothetical protein
MHLRYIYFFDSPESTTGFFKLLLTELTNSYYDYSSSMHDNIKYQLILYILMIEKYYTVESLSNFSIIYLIIIICKLEKISDILLLDNVKLKQRVKANNETYYPIDLEDAKIQHSRLEKLNNILNETYNIVDYETYGMRELIVKNLSNKFNVVLQSPLITEYKYYTLQKKLINNNIIKFNIAVELIYNSVYNIDFSIYPFDIIYKLYEESGIDYGANDELKRARIMFDFNTIQTKIAIYNYKEQINADEFFSLYFKLIDLGN